MIKPDSFRLQFFGPPTERGAVIIEERRVEARDISVAIHEAANAEWPPAAWACRLVDLEGRTVERDRP